MMTPDEVRRIGGHGPYGGCDLELYAEPARQRTVLYGPGRLARIHVPDVYIMRLCIARTRRYPWEAKEMTDLVGIVRREDMLYSTGAHHGDGYGFVCTGAAGFMVAREEITPSDAMWMTTFVEASSGRSVEHALRTTRAAFRNVDALAEAIRTM